MDDLAPSPEAPATLGETHEPRTPARLYALKDRDTFLVADAFGDVLGAGDGLFHDDTRILSRFQLLLGSHPPSLLSAVMVATGLADGYASIAMVADQALKLIEK